MFWFGKDLLLPAAAFLSSSCLPLFPFSSPHFLCPSGQSLSVLVCTVSICPRPMELCPALYLNMMSLLCPTLWEPVITHPSMLMASSVNVPECFVRLYWYDVRESSSWCRINHHDIHTRRWKLFFIFFGGSHTYTLTHSACSMIGTDEPWAMAPAHIPAVIYGSVVITCYLPMCTLPMCSHTSTPWHAHFLHTRPVMDDKVAVRQIDGPTSGEPEWRIDGQACEQLSRCEPAQLGHYTLDRIFSPSLEVWAEHLPV